MELLGLYLRLFLSFFKIGLFGFGGGYAMLPLIRYEVVNAHNWLSLSDFTDIVAISQTTPGPVSFNMATFVGYKAVCESGYSVLGAVLGAAVCTFAVSLPALILMGILTRQLLGGFRNERNAPYGHRTHRSRRPYADGQA